MSARVKGTAKGRVRESSMSLSGKFAVTRGVGGAGEYGAGRGGGGGGGDVLGEKHVSARVSLGENG
jgi:hypothetical protein